MSWQRRVRHEIRDIAKKLAEDAGPAAWVGRMTEDRNGKQVHLCTSQAQAWFDGQLARALPMATAHPDRRQEDRP